MHAVFRRHCGRTVEDVRERYYQKFGKAVVEASGVPSASLGSDLDFDSEEASDEGC